MATSTLDTTVGGASANAYVTVAVADQYHEDRPPIVEEWGDLEWSSASEQEKTQAILWATKLLDINYDWAGDVVTYTQALLWPRHGLYYRNGDYVAATVIPTELQHATAEMARHVLGENRTAETDAEINGLSALRIGNLQFQFKEKAVRVIPPSVSALIPDGWGAVKGSLLELVRA